MQSPELQVTILLRVLGCIALCALGAVVMPYSWMNVIHGYLGLGTLPDVPIVSYLARSLSMFYALFGAISLFASSNVRRHRELVTVLALMSIVLGISLFGIDYVSGMPAHWTVLEGPFTIAVGLAILALQRQKVPVHGPEP